MQEQLISFETAKLAKEKGFELVKYLSIDDENPKNLNSNYNPRNYQPWYFDLTQSLLQKWLREFHNIDVIINTYRSQNNKWYKYFISEQSKDIVKSDDHNSYEEALEIGLQEALKLI